jgi:hypothetical protein
MVSYRTVSAGDVDANYDSKMTLSKNIYNLNMISGGKNINLHDFDVYVVIGNSMKIHEIGDKDFIIVDRLYGNDKYNVKKGSALLLEIDRNKDEKDKNIASGDNKVEFKLRRHISYIDSTEDFDTWFNNLSADNKDIFAQQEHIRSKYENSVEKYKQNNSDAKNFVFTFSSTLDERTNEVKYSFHPVKFLNGIVKYVVKNEDVPD